jgi:hypothetical protein
MALGDYVDRRWKVIQAEMGSCEKGDDVAFLGKLSPPGTPDKVMTRCTRNNENIDSFDGQYDKDTDTINGVTNGGAYEIRMVEVAPDQKRQVKFTQQGGSRAGSWTAEDNGSWPGDG